MSNVYTVEALKEAVEASLRNSIARIIDDIINEAKNTLIDRIRGETTSVAGRVFQCFDYVQDTNRLIITVNFEGLK